MADAPASAPEAPAAASPGVRMPTINDVKLAGRLTADPEFKTVGKQSVANFNIASQKFYRDAQNRSRSMWTSCP